MSHFLHSLRRIHCCLFLATIFSLSPAVADTNPAALASDELDGAHLSERAEASVDGGARGATRPTEEASISVTNAVVQSAPSPGAETTNAAQSTIRNPQSAIATAADLPTTNVTGSFLRVMAMLALVLGLFIAGAWLFRNWQRLTIHRGSAPKLNILETRSLGGRHALFVVGYENERFLVSTSPAGINMLTHLQSADETAPAEDKPAATPQPTFASTLAQMLKGKNS